MQIASWEDAGIDPDAGIQVFHPIPPVLEAIRLALLERAALVGVLLPELETPAKPFERPLDVLRRSYQAYRTLLPRFADARDGILRSLSIRFGGFGKNYTHEPMSSFDGLPIIQGGTQTWTSLLFQDGSIFVQAQQLEARVDKTNTLSGLFQFGTCDHAAFYPTGDFLRPNVSPLLMLRFLYEHIRLLHCPVTEISLSCVVAYEKRFRRLETYHSIGSPLIAWFYTNELLMETVSYEEPVPPIEDLWAQTPWVAGDTRKYMLAEHFDPPSSNRSITRRANSYSVTNSARAGILNIPLSLSREMTTERSKNVNNFQYFPELVAEPDVWTHDFTLLIPADSTGYESTGDIELMPPVNVGWSETRCRYTLFAEAVFDRIGDLSFP